MTKASAMACIWNVIKIYSLWPDWSYRNAEKLLFVYDDDCNHQSARAHWLRCKESQDKTCACSRICDKSLSKSGWDFEAWWNSTNKPLQHEDAWLLVVNQIKRKKFAVTVFCKVSICWKNVQHNYFDLHELKAMIVTSYYRCQKHERTSYKDSPLRRRS